jgi:TPP-dependent trihydroxycyclohexane-1,2-dione (THcHDO) dehydratase
MQLSVHWNRQQTQNADRLQQLMVSKSVFMVYGFGQVGGIGVVMRQLVPQRESFNRQTGATTQRATLKLQFAQLTDIKR